MPGFAGEMMKFYDVFYFFDVEIILTRFLGAKYTSRVLPEPSIHLYSRLFYSIYLYRRIYGHSMHLIPFWRDNCG